MGVGSRGEGGVVRRADRVVAASPFFNERDVLRMRLLELAGVVDCHVFCEAAWTYAGSPKALRCAEWAVEVAAPLGGVETVDFGAWRLRAWESALGEVRVVELVDEPPPSFQDVYQPFGDRERWRRENWQRAMLGEGLPGWLADGDVVALSDVDEVPSPLVVRWYAGAGATAIVQPALPLHVGALNWRWRASVPVILRLFRGERVVRRGWSLEGVRRAAGAALYAEEEWARGRPGEVFPGDVRSAFGWHFSYLGGAEAVRFKVREAAHPEFDVPAFVGEGVVEERLRDGRDLFGRGGFRDAEWVGRACWPRCVAGEPEAWRHLMVPNPAAPDELW
jgi:beta-1,4-mannosyl-glycoprotein beta-1,4-N-acetylglucosaminyltransferase